MVDKEEKVREYKDLTSAEKLRLAIRYKAWFDSCMKGTPLQSHIFTQAAGFVLNTVLNRQQENDDDIRVVETYLAWHTSCMEGKPATDEDSVRVAVEVRKSFLTPDGRNANPEFG